MTVNDALALVRRLAADKIGTVSTTNIVFSGQFRDICKSNSCGRYNTCYTCPPLCGEWEELAARVKSYRTAVVAARIFPLTDSFDIEGMAEAAKAHDRMNAEIRKALAAEGDTESLVLGAGGCSFCETCAVKEHQPCRHPDLITIPLEACGISVYDLATAAGIPYTNGENTVTYFTAVLLK